MSREYLRGMDGLRALGVACVLIAHLWPRPGTVLDYFHFGRFGVILFFVISGFLVVRALLDLRLSVENQCESRFRVLTTFYYRRVLRIFPVYYLSLGVIYLSSAAPTISDYIVWHVFYVTNYGILFDIDFGNTGHFWTLAVEEQFYLLIPFLVIFLDRRHSRRLLLIILFAGVLVKLVTAYWLGTLQVSNIWNKVTHPLWGCVEGLCLGAFLAYKKPGLSPFTSGWVALLASGLLVLAASIYRYVMLANINQDVVYAAFAHIAFAVFSFFLIGHVLANQSGRLVQLLELSPLRWIGKISYGIYIFHYIAKPFISDWVTGFQHIIPAAIQPYALFVVGAIFSVVVASLSFVLIERPLLSLKKLYGGKSEEAGVAFIPARSN